MSLSGLGLLRAPLVLLERWYFGVLLKSCAHLRHDGIALYSFEQDSGAFFSLATDSLEHLQVVDPRRYRRAKTHLPTIIYAKLGMNHYVRSMRAFVVDEFEPGDIRLFAAMIVHEATHGYLADHGFQYDGKSRRRHEEICTREEFAFIRRTIQQQQADEAVKRKTIEEWRSWFDERMKTEWWKPNRIRRTHLQRLVSILR